MTPVELAPAAKNTRWYLSLFGASFGLLSLAAFLISLGSGGLLGKNAIRFDRLKPNEAVIQFGVSRRDQVQLKLGYLDIGPVPRVGLFGNHQIKYFSNEAFGRQFDAKRFFNYWGAAATLEDSLKLLTVLEEKHRLPTDLLIVQITTPNNDNGGSILGRDFNMPLFFKGGISRNFPWILFEKPELAVELANEVVLEINNAFNFITFLTGVTGGGTLFTQNLGDCASARATQPPARAWTRYLPSTIQVSLGINRASIACSAENLNNSLLADGSALHTVPEEIKIDEFPTDGRGNLSWGDDRKIADVIQQIADLAVRNRRKIIFLVPPIYESNRPSVVDRIFDSALAQLRPGIEIIDDRYAGRGRIDYFFAHDHPNNEYYKTVVARLPASVR